MHDSLLVDLLECHQGALIGVLTINREKSLNCLDLTVVEELSAQLNSWRNNSAIACVVIKGAGEKALCAGGDVRNIYSALANSAQEAKSYIKQFFAAEYGLFYQLHNYPKPVLAWANGIVMGGGLGLACSASHRVVTETSRLAMPEITIGLFPDASASWFLQRVPAKIGLFLGLTGAQLNAQDALLINWADYAISANDYDKVIDSLLEVEWSSISQQNFSLLSQQLAIFHSVEQLAPAQLLPRWQLIQQLMNVGDLAIIDKVFRRLNSADDWLQTAINTYLHGSPLTARVAWQLFQNAKTRSLAQLLITELNVAVNITQQADFSEGVRALLIDKDKNPHWSYAKVEQIDEQLVRDLLASPFAANAHPFSYMLASD